MTNNNLNGLYAELILAKKVLQVFTILNVIIFFLSLINILHFNPIFIIGIYYLFIIYFLGFIWLKMPMSKADKIGETLLILVFGIFALWMWLPDKKELKEIIARNQQKILNKK